LLYYLTSHEECYCFKRQWVFAGGTDSGFLPPLRFSGSHGSPNEHQESLFQLYEHFLRCFEARVAMMETADCGTRLPVSRVYCIEAHVTVPLIIAYHHNPRPLFLVKKQPPDACTGVDETEVFEAWKDARDTRYSTCP